MNFKHSGFSLIEAMLAVTIIGLVLAPLFLLEGTVLEQVMRSASSFERFVIAQNFLYQARRAQPIAARDFSLEGKHEKPLVQLEYRLAPVSENSVLSKFSLCRDQVIVTGFERGDRFTLSSLVYKPKGNA